VPPALSPSPSLEELADALDAALAEALADADAEAAAAAAAAAEEEEADDPGSTAGCSSHVHSAQPVVMLLCILALNPIWQEQSGANGQRSSHSESLTTVHQNVVAW